MDNFLDRARDLYPRLQDQRFIDAAQLVFKAISALQQVHSKSELNLFNLESLFTTFEMAATIGHLPDLFEGRDLEIGRIASDCYRIYARLFDALSR
jgi:hypothetical protein